MLRAGPELLNDAAEGREGAVDAQCLTAHHALHLALRDALLPQIVYAKHEESYQDS